MSFWGQKIRGHSFLGLSLVMEINELQDKLDIAIKALEEIKSMTFERYLMNNGWAAVRQMRDKAKHALNQIKDK